jgi:hypothetical protein
MDFVITVKEITSARWLIATCEQLPELIVQGANMTEIMQRVPPVARRILDRRRIADPHG